MKSATAIAALVGISLYVFPGAATPLPSNASSAVARTCNPRSPGYCTGTNYTASLQDTYVCGDSRLGPVVLPTYLEPLESVVELYERYGGLCPGEFLAKHWNASHVNPRTGKVEPSYEYPPFEGFSLDAHHQPMRANFTLENGTYVDRFGSESGNYTSPFGSPYIQRSLPPNSLNTHLPTGNAFNYYVYHVIKPFIVLAGPAAPWFEMPGQGVQYELYQPISQLLTTADGGPYLERVANPETLLPVIQ
ncbi:hypothetical protein B0T26DRAFT_848620 [Lasiosphaeria miniovina]|uniref:TNT domain-containing protein n=1 Tax=Lasiosphaeria miniovina TaxID=1954250 RepID=A0AA40EAG2_9PEZI|nr:uncharacterized protein B0T26DRAFT_848620 [Lasiosphaeria miniovina]KAK0728298.1 hypothetical protein B0T26DRAFT_848620 [Lasiosphaeria miniovina]